LPVIGFFLSLQIKEKLETANVQMYDRVFVRETGSSGFSGLVDEDIMTVCNESRNFGFIIIQTGEVKLG
jgi:hypothetical protein